MRLLFTTLLMFQTLGIFSQSLFINGSFENYTDYWYNRARTRSDSCFGAEFTQDVKDIYWLEPNPLPSDWPVHRIWHHPFRNCNCTYAPFVKTKNLFGTTSMGFIESKNTGLDAPYLALKAAIPLKKNVKYLISYFTNIGDTMKSSSGYIYPTYYSNGLGFFMSTVRPIVVDKHNSFKPKNVVHQMPFIIPSPGWHSSSHIITADSAYSFIAFGIFDSSYKIQYKKYYPNIIYKNDSIKPVIFLDSVNVKPWGLKKPQIFLLANKPCKGKNIKLFNTTLENVTWEINNKIVAIDSVLNFVIDTSSTIVAWNSYSSDTLRITPDSSPVLPIISQNDYWCNNTIKLSVKGGDYTTLKWLPDNKSDTAIQISDTLPRTLILTKNKTCIDSLKVNITHMCLPLLINDTIVCSGSTLNIANLNNEIVAWTVNQVPFGLSKSIFIKVEKTKLIVKAENSKGFDSVIVTVSNDCFDDFKLYIPSSFTPDNNGLNDMFKPLSNKPITFTITIYNMWGQKIYESNSSNLFGWNGSQCSAGYYIYVINVSHLYKSQVVNENRKGKVLLIR